MNAYKLILAAALAAILTGCAGQPESQECITGITCPEGTKCAAVQAICITNDCGDGIEQGTEACDDGNIEDGDGCAANCQSREVCGDGVLNAAAGELCDDGNTTGGDGCAADCVSVEICGNGVRDVNELCDDGNTVPGDGCSGNCKSTEVCGNSIVDLNEKCDDGGAAGGCNADCQGGTGCGDGAIDRDGGGNALEECDDGNQDNQDDCTNQCNLNVCGDGIEQLTGARIEECDPAVNFGETAACNLDCTDTECGDNKINNVAGEQCDDGTGMNADDRDCTATCVNNVCGDTLVNAMGSRQEDCDDGNTDNADNCPNTCQAKFCGNGIREMSEACDDGGNVDDDGCSSGCLFESCGDGVVNGGEDCDAGSGGVPAESATCNINCTAIDCGDLIVNRTAGEECDDGNAADDGDACRNSCELNVCGDGSKSATELCDDGDTNNTNTCTNSCTTVSCGDGVRQGAEQCDDGNSSELDGCLTTCVYATCGDMFVRTGVEDCDAGVAGNGPTKNCLANCKTNVCGDGFIDQEGTGASQLETCDDRNSDTETGCPYGVATCTACRADCDATLSLTGNTCGDGNPLAGTEVCDDNNTTLESECAYGAAGGMCDVCNATCSALVAQTGPYCGDGNTTNGETCDDSSPTQSCGRCNNACSVQTAAAAAHALIIASDNGGSQIGDGDTLVLRDGVLIVTFEFDKNGMPAGTAGATYVVIDASGTQTATQIRDRLFTAINGVAGFRLTATKVGTVAIDVANQRSSSIGNTTISRTGLGGEFYTPATFTGGAAGDCPMGVACTSDDDCLDLDGNAAVGDCVSGVCD
jgi:cysteine-rich repeat protein